MVADGDDEAAPSDMVVLRCNVKNLGPDQIAMSENVADTLGIICPCGKDCLSRMTRAEVTEARILTANAMRGRAVTQHARNIVQSQYSGLEKCGQKTISSYKFDS